ncbi:Mur ligase family protein [Paenibacillus chitinolyticus]
MINISNCSNGKTTTKYMINSVMLTKYRVHKTVGYAIEV